MDSVKQFPAGIWKSSLGNLSVQVIDFNEVGFEQAVKLVSETRRSLDGVPVVVWWPYKLSPAETFQINGALAVAGAYIVEKESEGQAALDAWVSFKEGIPCY